MQLEHNFLRLKVNYQILRGRSVAESIYLTRMKLSESKQQMGKDHVPRVHLMVNTFEKLCPLIAQL